MRSKTAGSAAFASFFLLATQARALSSWYTVPGSNSPAGSTPGDKIRGVNLGGWFILENWMMPDFFSVSPLDQYTVPDEWTYCEILGQTECLSRLQKHWDTWVTEEDFKRFAQYGLNTVRIPMGYWAWTDIEWYEPYVQGQLPYLERALQWADTYGMDVMMDLHGLPGGQNGQDNQGFKGPIEFPNNKTNVERAMLALTNMTSYTTSNKFNAVVKAIELTNEPYIIEYNLAGMEFDVLADFYVQGYAAVRAAENIMSGNNEVMVVIHDAFQPLLNWEYFWSTSEYGQNWTNYALDTHQYDAFGGASNKNDQEHLDTICALSSSISESQAKWPTIVGEFSIGVNTYCVDYQSCWGLSLSDVDSNLTSYNSSLFLREFWEVQSDVYELGAGWIFWSHKNILAGPWSWSQSVTQNWIPQDPTEKIWPFNSSASSNCLDLNNPLDGDQNWPSFPDYMATIENVTLAANLNTSSNSNSSSIGNVSSADANLASSSLSGSNAVTAVSASGSGLSASAKSSSSPSSSSSSSSYTSAASEGFQLSFGLSSLVVASIFFL